MNNPMPTMLTITKTAAKSGLSEYYIRQLCKQNKIVHVRAGAKFLINFEKLCDYLNDGEVAQQGPECGNIRMIDGR